MAAANYLPNSPQDWKRELQHPVAISWAWRPSAEERLRKRIKGSNPHWRLADVTGESPEILSEGVSSDEDDD